MTPFGMVATPDERLMQRLVGLLRRGAGATPFITAGHALTNAVMATRGIGDLPDWAEDLADAMVGALILVQQRTQGLENADIRVELATAAAVLGVVRPRVAPVCRGAITVWLGFGMPPARWQNDPNQLAARTLLFLALDDTDAAIKSIDALLEFGGAPANGVLHDWTVSRVQRHGPSREAQCFHNLRLALMGYPSATLQLLAAIVVMERMGRGCGDALGWLDQVAVDIRDAGTSCRASA